MKGKLAGEKNPMYGKKHSKEVVEKARIRSKNGVKKIQN
jgi:hypothetical protein